MTISGLKAETTYYFTVSSYDGLANGSTSAEASFTTPAGGATPPKYQYSGDLNGDGIADLVIGAPKANGGNGAAYILFGRASWASCRTVPCTSDLSTDADVTIIGYRNAQFDQAAPGAGRVSMAAEALKWR